MLANVNSANLVTFLGDLAGDLLFGLRVGLTVLCLAGILGVGLVKPKMVFYRFLPRGALVGDMVFPNSL